MSESDLANSQHRVMVLTQIVKMRLVRPGKRLSHQMQTSRCSRREHHIVVVTVCMEPLENDFACFLGENK